MKPLSPIAGRIIAFVVLAALAGCQAGPPLALMSPLEAGGGYGYSERQLSERRYEVSYLGPITRTSPNRTKREEDSETARSLAYDLALWRAAALASQNDFAAFRVENTGTELEVEVIDEGPFFPHYNFLRPHGFHDAGERDFPGYSAVFRSAWLRARVTLTVAMQATISDDAFDAAATVKRLRDKHPSAVAPPQY